MSILHQVNCLIMQKNWNANERFVVSARFLSWATFQFLVFDPVRPSPTNFSFGSPVELSVFCAAKKFDSPAHRFHFCSALCVKISVFTRPVCKIFSFGQPCAVFSFGQPCAPNEAFLSAVCSSNRRRQRCDDQCNKVPRGAGSVFNKVFFTKSSRWDQCWSRLLLFVLWNF